MFYTYLTYSKKCDARHREDKKDVLFIKKADKDE